MSAELIVTAHYNHCPDALFQRASNFGDMIEATRKISTYSGLPPVQMEEGENLYNRCESIRPSEIGWL